MNYFLDAFKHYAQFDGRTTRQGFWMFMLFDVIILAAFSMITGMVRMGGMNDMVIFGLTSLAALYNLAVFIPSLAIGVRRLHDVNVSGLYILIGLIPFIGGLILIFAYWIKPGTPSANQFGAAPAAGMATSNPGAPGAMTPPAAMPPASMPPTMPAA